MIDEALRTLVAASVADAVAPLVREVAELLTALRREEQAPEREQLLTTADVAEHVQVDEKTVRTWIRKGDLRACRAGRELRVRPVDLEAFLARRDSETIDETTDEMASRLLSHGAR